jgi:hypothetical protein
MSPVRYELGFYIPEDDILYSDRREHLRSYIGNVSCMYSNLPRYYHAIDFETLKPSTIQFFLTL